MARIPVILFLILGPACPAALAHSETASQPEPISVAVAPPDDGVPAANSAAEVPAAESKAAATKTPPPPPDKPDPPQIDEGHKGIGLKIEPFGWRIGLIGH